MCKLQPTYLHRRFSYDSSDLFLLNVRYSDVFDVKLRFKDGDRQVSYDASDNEEQLVGNLASGVAYGCIIMPYNKQLVSRIRKMGYRNTIVAIVGRNEPEYRHAMEDGYDIVLCNNGKAVEKLYPVFKEILLQRESGGVQFLNKHLLKYQAAWVSRSNLAKPKKKPMKGSSKSF